MKIKIRQLAGGAAALALCATQIMPAAAQSYRFTVFDAPRGATATVNLRVPLGGGASARRSTLGFMSASAGSSAPRMPTADVTSARSASPISGWERTG